MSLCECVCFCMCTPDAPLKCVWCMCARQHLCECMHVFVLHSSKRRALSKCNTLVWWPVAGGGRSNALSEANSMLTSQRCHMLVLAHSPVGQSQSKPISQARSGSVNPNPPQPSTLPPLKTHSKLFFLPLLLEAFEWRRSMRSVKGGAAH